MKKKTSWPLARLLGIQLTSKSDFLGKILDFRRDESRKVSGGGGWRGPSVADGVRLRIGKSNLQKENEKENYRQPLSNRTNNDGIKIESTAISIRLSAADGRRRVGLGGFQFWALRTTAAVSYTLNGGLGLDLQAADVIGNQRLVADQIWSTPLGHDTLSSSGGQRLNCDGVVANEPRMYRYTT
ncbi:aldolase-type TIM barrel family protein [Striga asiatica]|uniref:Aldolase-type TIM barrel family protein n=1 Tax=Striga asiatica TaxID=4170 RepID=A0A5A7P959_STRAF|nr:aldolase-type TIM barrel family protein [Striga asiatica]